MAGDRAGLRRPRTVVLIGDPKQAIYAFRGGDIVTYLKAARTPTSRATLGTNWRSDQPLVEQPPGGAPRRRARATRTSWSATVEARHQGHRLAGAPHNDAVPAPGGDPREVRAHRHQHRRDGPRPRPHRRATSPPTSSALLGQRRDVRRPPGRGRRRRRHRRGAQGRAGVPRRAGRRPGSRPSTPATPTCSPRRPPPTGCACSRPSSSRTAAGWCGPRRPRCSSARPPPSLAAGGDAAHRPGRRHAARVGRPRAGARRGRGLRGRAGRAGWAAGCWAGGRRAPHDRPARTSRRCSTRPPTASGSACPRCSTGCAPQCSERGRTAERNRRLDSDAAAVQIMTVWVSKGLQYPLVYLPFAFNRNVPDARQRCCSTATAAAASTSAARAGAGFGRSRPWPARRWPATTSGSPTSRSPAPSRRSSPGGRRRGTSPTAGCPGCSAAAVRGDGAGARPVRAQGRRRRRARRFRAWEAGGRPGGRGVRRRRRRAAGAGRPPRLGVRRFVRPIDTSWRRTSYSGLIRAAERDAGGVASEPEVPAARRRGGWTWLPRAGAAGAGSRPALADGRPARGRDLRLAGARRCSSTPTRRARPRSPSWPRQVARAARVVAGRRRAPRSSPTRWCRCTTPRSGRSRPA